MNYDTEMIKLQPITMQTKIFVNFKQLLTLKFMCDGAKSQIEINFFQYLASKSGLGPPRICIDHVYTHYSLIITNFYFHFVTKEIWTCKLLSFSQHC